MKERPILFSGPMVRAILAGTKTQTRRLVKHPEGDLVDPRGDAIWQVSSDGLWHPCIDMLARGALDPIAPGLRCPYGQPGERLWVRETWALLNGDGEDLNAKMAPPGVRAMYRADHSFFVEPSCWRPSIHMPRWASRLTLEVTGVRVERLQDISEEDARAEGVTLKTEHLDAREAFRVLWDSINGDRASWASNPWVWTVSFKVAEVRR